MAFGLHSVPDFFDFSVRPDQERAADDAEKRFAEEILHTARPVGLNYGEIGITEQRKIQIVFFLERSLRFHGIAARAKDHHSKFVVLLLRVAKLGRFDGSTGSVGLWKEKEDHALAAEI